MDSTDRRAPNTIYLQVEDYDEHPLCDWTWCEDKINDTDIAYIRADRRAELEWRELAKSYQYLYEQRCADLDRALDLQRKALKEAREWRERYERTKEAFNWYCEVKDYQGYYHHWWGWEDCRSVWAMSELNMSLQAAWVALRREVEETD